MDDPSSSSSSSPSEPVFVLVRVFVLEPVFVFVSV
jgi:hypothetical protein